MRSPLNTVLHAVERCDLIEDFVREQRPEPLVAFVGPVLAAFGQVRADVLPDARAEHVVHGILMSVRQAQLVRRPPDGGDDGVVGLDQGPADVGDNEVHLPTISSQCKALQRSPHGRKPRPSDPANKRVDL